jgi:uncharacterized membrane protein YqaE (UPF0057 family)
VLYLVAILLPPLAMFMAGKAMQAILCVVLMITLIGWPVAILWAIFVVNNKYADDRTKRLIEAQQKAAQEQVAAMHAMTNQQLAAAKAQMDLQAAQVIAPQTAPAVTPRAPQMAEAPTSEPESPRQ